MAGVDVDGRIILKRIIIRQKARINLAQDLGNFRAVLNGVMKLAVVQSVV